MVVVITHNDADGACSAALVKARYPDCKVRFSRPICLHNDLKKWVSEDIVFVCDIGVNEPHRGQVQKLATRLGNRLVYLDHHPHGLKGHPAKTGRASSQLVYEYLGRDLEPDMKWIAVFGCLADRLETPFVEQALLEWDRPTIDFEATLLSLGLELARNQFKLFVIDELSKGKFPSRIRGMCDKAAGAVEEERNIRSFVHANVEKAGQVSYVVNPPGRGFSGKAAIFARAFGKTKVGVCARETEGGMDISVRAIGVDLGRLVQKASEKAGGSGGGHPYAAGATIPPRRLMDFIKELGRSI